ncbi:hypothetical protein ACFX14_012987 [Malus domestica]
MMGDPLGSSRVSSQKQNREGVIGAQRGQYRATAESSLGCGGGPGQDVTICTRPFGSSLASGSIGTLKLSESNPMMGDPLGSSCMSSQKQNCEGVIETQSRQYHATTESSPGCGGGPGGDVTDSVL